MNIQSLMNELFRWCADGAPHDYSGTCDTLKTGNPETEVHKVAVSMFATPAVIRAAHEWGAELLIVHEPTFYAHMDDNFAELGNRDGGHRIVSLEHLERRYGAVEEFLGPLVDVEYGSAENLTRVLWDFHTSTNNVRGRGRYTNSSPS